MKTLLVMLAASGLLLAGCSYRSVYSDYDTTVDFTQTARYRWAEKSPAARQSKYRSQDPLLEKRVRRAVEAGLEGKGLRLVEAGRGADLLVDAFVVTARTRRMSSGYFGMGYGSWPGYRAGGFDLYASHRGPRSGVRIGLGYPGLYGTGARYHSGYGYLQGAVVVEMFSASDGEMVWRGWSNESFRPGLSPEDSEKLVQNAVRKILEKFPPRR